MPFEIAAVPGRTVESARWFGVYAGLVADIKDPDNHGRVKVTLPTAPDGVAGYEAWARLATLMAGHNRGSWFIPDVNDEVLVAFEAGDPRRPYVLGALWSRRNPPLESMDGAGSNYKKVLRSRNGVKVTLDDQDGQEKLLLETPGGQKISLKDGAGSIIIEDSNGNSLTMASSGVTINASAKVTIAAGSIAISASMLTIDAGMVKVSGVVQADTVIANSVVASSYSPGAGNIW
jgi:uncharacterized protein involved in type VI secretion and phage assembly